MPSLFGYRDFSPSELKRRLGRMSQVAGIRQFQFTDGRAAGVRALDFHTGSGLAFTVLVDRCMDIYSTSYKGIPLAWEAMAGVVAPTYYEPEGISWLRSWGAGLMTTCGFEQVGTACEDQGSQLGLHGRAGNLPAENVRVDEAWEGDDYVLKAQGQVRQGYFIWDSYLFTREIVAVMGQSTIRVHDRVENVGFCTLPFEFLYHINFGFPLVDETARLIFPSRQVTPRDEIAQAGLDAWDQLSAPIKDFQEQVFEHVMLADEDGYVSASVVNEALAGGLGVCVRYEQQAYPYFAQWKQMGEGIYSLGFEPGNCHPHGRRKERERGTLAFLEPGEVREFNIQFDVLDGQEAINAVEQKCRQVVNQA